MGKIKDVTNFSMFSFFIYLFAYANDYFSYICNFFFIYNYTYVYNIYNIYKLYFYI